MSDSSTCAKTTKMANVVCIRRAFGKSLFGFDILKDFQLCQVQFNRNRYDPPRVPKPGNGKAYRRIVHYPESYTVKPLDVTNLAGRDPVSGRVVAKGIGGGIKHKFHWIKWIRDGPTDINIPPKEEKVLEIFVDGCRTAHVALVGCGRELKYILATENMKAGDIIKTHCGLTKDFVRAKEGDAYPLGCLPLGTIVHSIERIPGKGGCMINAAGTCGKVLIRDGPNRVIVSLPSGDKLSFFENCMATVGRLSNITHGRTPIGSAQRNRELGNRPRSGLWQRKTGRSGRKIRPPPPIWKVHNNAFMDKPIIKYLTLSEFVWSPSKPVKSA